MTTYRERREARAERLRGWAEKRETKASAELEQASQMADAIPFGQPILVDHYSAGRDRNYRNRIASKTQRACESLDKAAEMAAKADNIEAAAERAIYSDDVDAVERLAERVAELEGERERIKAFNATCRKGAPDLSLLDEAQRRNLASIVKHCPYQLGPKGQYPGYALSNLGGNINRQRKRLTRLQRDRGES